MYYPYKALILEDHPLQCAYLRELLQDAGFQHVDASQCGAQALELLSRMRYDVVLLDLDMPDMDGMQFIRELANRKVDAALAISSACTPRMMDSASRMARDMHLTMIDCYAKPLTSDQAHRLGAALRRLRRQADAGQQQRQPMPSQAITADTIQAALASGEILPWFQPKYSLSDGTIRGVEVLARWQHPDAGLLAPGIFLPCVQEHHLDMALLRHMLDGALHVSHQWRRHGFRVPLSINLPTHLLDDDTLPDQLLAHVQRHDSPVEDITFELLENSTTIDPALFLMGASRLRLKGFGLSQDDFGIGFSSLHSLASVPFTELKIDRAFVTGVSGNAALSAIATMTIQLGRKLGMQVTAEGVESLEDLVFLRRAGVDCAQGFLLSRPIPAHALFALLEADRRLPDAMLPPLHA